jgi:glycosyltransferase involved in cell wall biosynthesis
VCRFLANRVIPEPSTIYLSVTRAICSTSTRVIVLSDLGRRILIDVYGVDETKIMVVPHGVPDTEYSHSLADAKLKLGYDANVPIVTTFGLLHRNKNIQLGLKAISQVVEDVPDVTYLVIGQTHPVIQSQEGESYRRELERNVSALGLTKNVEFVNKYVDDDELMNYLAATDIYLTPYAREDQYVSGTLAWAVGLGKAVVSTPYLYAKDLLADGRGFLVPFEDHEFLGATLSKVIQDDSIRDGARHQAYKYGRQMTWPSVGRKLEELFRELLLYA